MCILCALHTNTHAVCVFQMHPLLFLFLSVSLLLSLFVLSVRWQWNEKICVSMRLVETSVSPASPKNRLITMFTILYFLLLTQPVNLQAKWWNNILPAASAIICHSYSDYIMWLSQCFSYLSSLSVVSRGEMSRWGNVYERPHPAEPYSRMGH